MLLTTDVGNTDTVLGIWEDKRLLSVSRFQTKPDRKKNEWRDILIKCQNDIKIRYAQDKERKFTEFIYGSVVPSVDNVLEEAVKSLKFQKIKRIDSKIKLPFRHKDIEISKLGADRIANMAAGVSLYSENIIIADFGTAITFCLILNKEYKGGVIAPSLRVSLNGLISHTAKLPFVKPEKLIEIPGKTTEQSLQMGLQIGWRGLVKEIIFELKKRASKDTICVATGGISENLDYLYENFDVIDKNLTLRGLMLLYSNN
ncbi:MAG: type III pantothenate kinase [Spirochaetia bacterium]|nr:type III pantothenate kinase [Spirochaetia bacterium]